MKGGRPQAYGRCKKNVDLEVATSGKGRKRQVTAAWERTVPLPVLFKEEILLHELLGHLHTGQFLPVLQLVDRVADAFESHMLIERICIQR
jgi:hypothetical protein